MVKSSKTTAELNSVVVALDGEPIGILSATPDKYRYSYYSEYEATPDARVLSYNYPLGGGPFDYSFAGALPPYFEHLMPEGWLKEVAESSHLPMSTPLQKLATLCRDNLGAVEIHGPFTAPVPDRAEASARIVVDRQMEVPSASLLTQDAPSAKYPKWWHCVRCHEKLPSLGHNRNFHDHCAESFFGAAQAPALAITNETLVDIGLRQLARHESLTGVQPKFSATFKAARGTLADPAFIVKPEPMADRMQDGIFFKHSSVAELAAMHFVEMLELGAAETALLYLNDNQPALISKRFDRADGRKIHTEDLAQTLGVRDKYRSSHEKIAGILRKIPDEEDRTRDLRRLLKVILVNFIIGNCDGHLKNYSLIHERAASPSGRLAPFYDILPVRMFAKKDPNQLGLTVDGKANRLTIDNFDRMAIRMGLSIALIDDYVEEIAVNLNSFYTTFLLFGVPDDFVEELRQYCDAGLATLRRRLDRRQRNNQLR